MFNLNDNKITRDLSEGLRKPTKREFLGIIMSIFDPLGLLSPFTIQARILMQDIWSSKINWDLILPDLEFSRWKQWLKEIKTVISFRLSRCYQIKEQSVRSAELHVFCDATSKAYAVVAYWRFSLINNSFRVVLIGSRSRVAPLKVVSIP